VKSVATTRGMASTAQLLAVAALVAVVIVAMILSSRMMYELRVAVPPLSRAMSWLERLQTPFDMDHVAFFTVMVCLVRLILPRVRWWWIAVVVGVLAAGTELLQFWVPGRTPRLLDVRDDLLGGAIGLILGTCLLALWRALRERHDRWQKSES
jgi:hypothetical protein